MVAYGALLGKDLLALPAYGWVNLHFLYCPLGAARPRAGGHRGG